MFVFIFNGIIYGDMLETIDRAISLTKDTDTSSVFWAIGSMGDLIEIDCFDTETGSRTNGAEALALFFNLRKKELEIQAKLE